MLKNLKKKLNNSNKGNTFIIVLVTIATMGILIGVILASMGYYYRMRLVDLENKNNFYYVEKAMDDIYTGVGSESVNALMYAYEETVQVMVYYDTTSGRYIPIDEASANKIMKQKFLSQLATSSSFASQEELYKKLKSFISVDGVELVDPSTLEVTQPKLYMEVVTSKETKEDGTEQTVYDKLVIRNVTVKRTTSEGYVQSITTDIEISEPEFNVSFNNADGKTNALYDFALIGDMGIEFNDATVGNQEITVTGNVYASADYYNKVYNEDEGTRISNYYDGSHTDQLAACNGSNETSKYSGIYARSSNVSIMADKVIVPGSISVIDDSNVHISGNLTKGTSNLNSDVWADNIVIAPSYTRTVGKKMDEGNFTMYADAYIADDLEINGDKAVVELSGNYYGYNYSQTSESERVLSEYAKSGKAHFNSSAIIVNGNEASVDMTGLKNLYVAGRSYISTSTIRQTTVNPEDNSATTTYVEVDNGTETKNVDVRTGESISVKSNQLAYMPMGTMTYNGQDIPKFTNSYEAFNYTIYENIKGWLDDENPMVTQTISGNTYYFLNFTSATSASAFFDWYANVLPTIEGYALAKDLVDVKNFSDYNVSKIQISETGINKTTVTASGAYTTGALNVASKKSLKITAPGLSSDLIGGESETITNFSALATAYNSDYMEYKYALMSIDLDDYDGELKTKMETLKDDIAAMDSKSVTPIAYYLDFSEITGTAMASGVKIGNSYVWISSGDVTVKAPAGTDGKVTGIVIAKGDVKFETQTDADETVTRFEGLVVSGSKIKVDHDVDFIANPEIIKTILRTAEATKDDVDDYSGICKIFKDYESSSEGEDSGSAHVGNIEIGDILQYSNWKKNVE